MGWDGRGCESHPQLHGHVRAHATLNFGKKLGVFKGWCGGSMALGFVGFTRVVLGRDVAALGHRHQVRVAWSDVLPPLGRRNKAFQSALASSVGARWCWLGIRPPECPSERPAVPSRQ